MSENEWPPRPEWHPILSIDLDRIKNKCAYYHDYCEGFVIFENGTCVLADTKSDHVIDYSINILTNIINAHPDFKSYKMKDGNWIVEYKEPAINIIFDDEYIKNQRYIEKNFKSGILSHEVFRNQSGEIVELNSPADQIGLLGRAQMFLDALNPCVSTIWKTQN